MASSSAATDAPVAQEHPHIPQLDVAYEQYSDVGEIFQNLMRNGLTELELGRGLFYGR